MKNLNRQECFYSFAIPECIVTAVAGCFPPSLGPCPGPSLWEVSLTHIRRRTLWWASVVYAKSWDHLQLCSLHVKDRACDDRGLNVKHCLFKTETMQRKIQMQQAVNTSAWLMRSHMPSAWKSWKGFSGCSTVNWDCVSELSFAAVWSPLSTS